MRGWRRQLNERRAVLGGLAALLVLGTLLRLTFEVAWRPGFMGWPDAKSYLDVANGDLFGSVLRPAGYPMFIRLLDSVWTNIHLFVLVNHALGLATAVLLYLTVARTGVPRWLGLIPAAIVLLNGDQMFLEHSPLSEPLFTFLIVLALYAGVRTLEGGTLAWPALVGLTLGVSATVRVVGLAVLPVIAVWMLVGASERLRRRLASTAVAAVAGVAVLGVYEAVQYETIGQTGLSRNGAWHLYGRVAPFADCRRFVPPPGTEALCEKTPRYARATTDAYLFNYWFSPAIRIYNNPHASTPASTQQVGAFAQAALLHQPLDYLGEVSAGMIRYVAPESLKGVGGGPSYADLIGQSILFNPSFQKQGLDSVREFYGWRSRRFAVRPGVLRVLRGYESLTRIQGPLMLALVVFSLAGPFTARGRSRRIAWLLTLMAWTLMVVPVAVLEFSARTAVPAFGALGAAAAVGGWATLGRVRERRRARALVDRGTPQTA